MAIPYVPIDARGWRMTRGLRPLEIPRWIEVDVHRDEELALKRQLLADQPDVVVATRREGDVASAELHREVFAWLAAFAPDVPVSEVLNDHPIVAAARLVQEDLCVLVRDDAWRLQAACVCFPSRWRLATKIGRTLDQIHAPVPGYHDKLSEPTNGVFDRLAPHKAFWRLNWTVLNDATLHQLSAPRHSSPEDAEQWFFRVERQTIRRLSESDAIVFTIRTYVASLNELRSTPEFVEHLVFAIEGAPSSTQEYKGWVGVAQRLREAFA